MSTYRFEKNQSWTDRGEFRIQVFYVAQTPNVSLKK